MSAGPPGILTEAESILFKVKPIQIQSLIESAHCQKILNAGMGMKVYLGRR